MASTNLNTRLTLSDNLTAGLRRAQTNVGSFARSATQALFSLRGAFAAVATLGIGRLITSTTRAADDVGKLSDRLGLSTEFLSDFRFAAGQAGIEVNRTDQALQRVTRRFGELAEFGRGEAKPAIEALSEVLGEDLSERIRAGETFADLLPDIARGFSQITNEARRLAIAFKLFDTEGAALIQLLGQGEPAVTRGLAENPNRVTREAAAAAAAFNDELSRLGETLKSITRDIIQPALGPLTSALQTAQQVIQAPQTIARDPERFAFPLGDLDRIRELEEEIRLRQSFVGPRLPPGGLPPITDQPQMPGPAPFDPNAFVGPIDPTTFTEPGIGQMPLRRAVEPAKELETALDGIKAGVQDVTQAFSQFNLAREAVAEVAFTLSDGIVSNLDAITSGTKKASQAFADMGRSILNDLKRIAIQLLINRAIGAAFGGIGGLFSGATEGGTSGVNAGSATGMIVRPGTMRTVTLHGGRRGEAIVPLDRHVARGGGGGTTVVMHINTIDAQSFDERFLGSAARQGQQLGAVVVGASRQSPRLRRSMVG